LSGHIGDVAEPTILRRGRRRAAGTGHQPSRRPRPTRRPVSVPITTFCTFPSAHSRHPQVCANS
jgi:hypothetical protein